MVTGSLGCLCDERLQVSRRVRFTGCCTCCSPSLEILDDRVRTEPEVPESIGRSNGLRRSGRQALWVHTVGNVYVAIDEDWCRSTKLTENCDVASITASSLRCNHSHDHDRRAIRTRNLAPSIRREPKLLTDQAVSFPTRRYWETTNGLRLCTRGRRSGRDSWRCQFGDLGIKHSE